MAERKPVKCPKPAPCPWCGRKALLEILPAQSFVHCSGFDTICGVVGPSKRSGPAAIRAWNRIALKRGGKV